MVRATVRSLVRAVPSQLRAHGHAHTRAGAVLRGRRCSGSLHEDGWRCQSDESLAKTVQHPAAAAEGVSECCVGERGTRRCHTAETQSPISVRRHAIAKAFPQEERRRTNQASARGVVLFDRCIAFSARYSQCRTKMVIALICTSPASGTCRHSVTDFAGIEISACVKRVAASALRVRWA